MALSPHVASHRYNVGFIAEAESVGSWAPTDSLIWYIRHLFIIPPKFAELDY